MEREGIVRRAKHDSVQLGVMARDRCCARWPVERADARARECETAADWAGAGVADRRDNSALLDNNSANQRLTKADVDAMRAAGAAGADIIDAMVANSATFADKTQFSQARDVNGLRLPCPGPCSVVA